MSIAGCGQRGTAPAAPSGSPEASQPPVGDGAPHEAENQRYRERIPVAESARPALDAARARAVRKLVPLRSHPTEAEVRAALTAAGATAVWTGGDQAMRSVRFEAQIDQDGCLVGDVQPGSVTVDAAGFVRDGGCHALSGH